MALVDAVPLPKRLANLLAHARTTPADVGGWFRIANEADGDTATLTLYDEIGWFGTSDAMFAEALAAVTAKRIMVRLNSPGGSVFQGIAVANLLRSHPAHVTVSVDGLAASIASVIAIAGDEVIAQPQSQFMVHKASGLCLGNDDDMEEMRNLLRKQSENIARAYAARIPGSRWDTWYNRMAKETWFTAEEAVAVGLADRVGEYTRKPKPTEGEPEEEPEPGEEEAPATAAKAAPRVWDLSVFRYAGRAAAPDPMAEPAAGAPPEATHAGRQLLDLERLHDFLSAGNGQPPLTGTPIPEVTITITGAGTPEDITAAVRRAFTDPAPADTAVGPHSTAVEEGTWDAGAQEKRLPSPMPVATARRVYAWYDESQAENGEIPKSAAKLPHHFVGSDGTPGAASANGVRNALARLDQTHGPSDAEKDTIRRHLRGHLPSSDDDSEDRAEPPAAELPTPPAPLAFGRPRPDDTRTFAFGRGGST